MKIKDIRELTDKEIVARIAEEKEILLRLRFNHSISAIENPSKIRTARRLVAKLNTELRERQLKNSAKA